jgi:peroxiredoxin
MRFKELHAQVLGISVDSVYSHQAFAKELGHLDYPLLADFHPKGATLKAYGLWREERGYATRAVVIVDQTGVVRDVDVFPTGVPDVQDVLKGVKRLRQG